METPDGALIASSKNKNESVMVTIGHDESAGKTSMTTISYTPRQKASEVRERRAATEQHRTTLMIASPDHFC